MQRENAANSADALLPPADPNDPLAPLIAAAAASPDSYQAQIDLASSLLVAARHAEAAAHLAILHRRYPDDLPILNNLVFALRESGQMTEAVRVASAAANRRPQDHEIRLVVIKSLAKAGRLDLAYVGMENWARMISTDGRELHLFSGGLVTLAQMGRLDEAMAIADRLAARLPGAPQAQLLKAVMLTSARRFAEAAETFRSALASDPDNLDSRLALIRLELRQEGTEAARRQELLAELRMLAAGPPPSAAALVVLAAELQTAGAAEEALQTAIEALALPDVPAYARLAMFALVQLACDHEHMPPRGRMLDALHDCALEWLNAGFLYTLVWAESDEEVRSLIGFHRVWAERLASAPPTVPLAAPTPVRGLRPLRLGLLSSDLRRHSVGRFAEPLLRDHDPQRLAIHVYSSFSGEKDPLALDLAAAVTQWLDVDRLDDEALAGRIRADRIDVLVEMNGFTAQSRLPVIARRCAPVQAEWLGYPFSTGIAAMDHLIVDRHLQPERPDLLMEAALPLPGAWICVKPPTLAAPIPPPSFARGYITFGTLNNTYKFSRSTIHLWAAVLTAVPDAQFLIIRPEVARDSIRANIRRAFAAEGIAADRIRFLDNHGAKLSLAECYAGIDIALDTWPLTGGTTTVDSVMYGVPTVSRVGPAVHQRISFAILSHIGATALCARDDESYVATAVALANDREALARWHQRLPTMLAGSALCDAAGFVSGFTDTLAQAYERRVG